MSLVMTHRPSLSRHQAAPPSTSLGGIQPRTGMIKKEAHTVSPGEVSKESLGMHDS